MTFFLCEFPTRYNSVLEVCLHVGIWWTTLSISTLIFHVFLPRYVALITEPPGPRNMAEICKNNPTEGALILRPPTIGGKTPSFSQTNTHQEFNSDWANKLQSAIITSLMVVIFFSFHYDGIKEFMFSITIVSRCVGSDQTTTHAKKVTNYDGYLYAQTLNSLYDS